MFRPVRDTILLTALLFTSAPLRADDGGKPASLSPDEIISAWQHALGVFCPPYAHYREELARQQIQANLRRLAPQIDLLDPPMRPASVDPITALPHVPDREVAPLSGMDGWKVWSKGDPILTTTFHHEGRFTTRHQEGSLVLTVIGTIKEGKPVVSRVTVREGGEEKKYEALDKVPEEYRDKLVQLVELSGR